MPTVSRYLLISQDDYVDLYEDWIRHDHSIERWRHILDCLIEQDAEQYATKSYPKRPIKIPGPIAAYLATSRSPSEIAFLLHMCTRYISKRGYARLKLRDIASASGLSIPNLSRAASSLQSKGIISKIPHHPNFVIAHGSCYTFLDRKSPETGKSGKTKPANRSAETGKSKPPKPANTLDQTGKSTVPNHYTYPNSTSLNTNRPARAQVEEISDLTDAEFASILEQEKAWIEEQNRPEDLTPRDRVQNLLAALCGAIRAPGDRNH